MVDSAANVLLETLRDLLIEEVKFVSGVGDEVKKVEADLSTIHAMLMEADADRSRSESPVLKDCMSKLQELASRAENVLEKYAFQVQSKRQGKGLKKKFQRFMCILGEWLSVREIGDETINIRSCLSDLTAQLRSISGGGEGPSNSADQERRPINILIEDCEIEGDVMDVLGKFPMLQSLWLEGEVGVKKEMIFDANSFPQLKYLYLLGLNGLRKWEVENGAMPKLRYLYISKCINLEKLPDGVRFISTLQRLVCVGMPKEFKDRMRRDGGEDYPNFSHIPELDLADTTKYTALQKK